MHHKKSIFYLKNHPTYRVASFPPLLSHCVASHLPPPCSHCTAWQSLHRRIFPRRRVFRATSSSHGATASPPPRAYLSSAPAPLRRHFKPAPPPPRLHHPHRSHATPLWLYHRLWRRSSLTRSPRLFDNSIAPMPCHLAAASLLVRWASAVSTRTTRSQPTSSLSGHAHGSACSTSPTKSCAYDVAVWRFGRVRSELYFPDIESAKEAQSLAWHPLLGNRS
jgi:hypothetical protein